MTRHVRTTLSREYQLAQQAFGFTDEHLRELARNSFEASFLPAEKSWNSSTCSTPPSRGRLPISISNRRLDLLLRSQNDKIQ